MSIGLVVYENTSDSYESFLIFEHITKQERRILTFIKKLHKYRICVH